ncbi:TetR/AcrR family transcriptional regulator [Mariniluteicoccus flavus]
MPRTVDSDQRRTEIIHGVFAVIAESGLPGVTLRSVAAAAGVSMGRVQYYFRSKDDLVLAACAAMIGAAEQQYADRTARSPSLRAQLRHLALAGIPADAEQRIGASIWLAFVTAAATDERLSATIADAWRGTEDEITGLLRRAADDGVLGPGVHPRRAARTLTAAMNGLVAMVLAGALTHRQATEALGSQIDGLFTAG